MYELPDELLNGLDLKIILVYGEMSVTVYSFLSIWNFIPGWRKENKTCKHFISGSNFKMSMFFFNFWRMYSNMLSNLTCLNIMIVWIQWNIRPLYKKWSPKRKRIRKQCKNIFIVSIIFFLKFRKDWNFFLL